MDKSILTNFGGQGCIFNPSIPCKNEKRTRTMHFWKFLLFPETENKIK